MKISKFIESSFKRFIPSPFSLAVILSLFILLIATFFTGSGNLQQGWEVIKIWQSGMWNPAMLVFMVQMMLILVLGHILVLSKPISKLTTLLTNRINNNTQAVVVVAISTMLVAFFNWGLGLIFGAIMARKTAEAAQKRNFKINYPLIGAAGYVGLMVWHGGMSGSAPLKVAESGHLASLFPDNNAILNKLPENIETTTTIFSVPNLLVFACLLIVVPLVLYFTAKNTKATIPAFAEEKVEFSSESTLKGAERLDHSPIFKTIFGILLVMAFLASYHDFLLAGRLTPNMLNFLMLGLCVLFHQSFASFTKALKQAIVGAGAILIQFPLYFGIMAVMKETGLVGQISSFMVNNTNATGLPIASFFSAGLVNIFVPSGGGQWAVQGPIILESALKLDVPLNKMVMALAYGDQITNMLQPFWALPLLAITKLKARDILPYTLLLLIVGSVIYIGGLLLW